MNWEEIECGMCAHWLHKGRGQGQCRLNPPSVMAMPMQHKISGRMEVNMQAVWPVTAHDEPGCSYGRECTDVPKRDQEIRDAIKSDNANSCIAN